MLLWFTRIVTSFSFFLLLYLDRARILPRSPPNRLDLKPVLPPKRCHLPKRKLFDPNQEIYQRLTPLAFQYPSRYDLRAHVDTTALCVRAPLSDPAGWPDETVLCRMVP